MINQYYISILAGMMLIVLSTLAFASKALTDITAGSRGAEGAAAPPGV